MPYPFEHGCCVLDCNKPGTWGEGVFPLYGKQGRWYCFEHHHLIGHENVRSNPVSKKEQSTAEAG
jgi:hypothetical protein